MREFRRIVRQYQSVLVSGLLLLFLAVTLLTGILPSIRTILTLNTTRKTANSDVSLLRQKVGILDALSEQTLSDDLGRMLTAIPGEKSLPTVLGSLESIAVSSGVSLVEIEFAESGSIATASAASGTPEEKTLGTSFVPFSVSVNGSTSQIQQFIETSLTSRPLLRINHFSISVQQSGGYLARFDMNAFSAPLPATIGKASQKIENLTPKELATLTLMESYSLSSGGSQQFPPAQVGGPVKPDPFSR